jgi:hypothetical protein
LFFFFFFCNKPTAEKTATETTQTNSRSPHKQTAKALKGGGKRVDLFHYRWDKRGGEKEE